MAIEDNLIHLAQVLTGMKIINANDTMLRKENKLFETFDEDDDLIGHDPESHSKLPAHVSVEIDSPFARPQSLLSNRPRILSISEKGHYDQVGDANAQYKREYEEPVPEGTYFSTLRKGGEFEIRSRLVSLSEKGAYEEIEQDYNDYVQPDGFNWQTQIHQSATLRRDDHLGADAVLTLRKDSKYGFNLVEDDIYESMDDDAYDQPFVLASNESRLAQNLTLQRGELSMRLPSISEKPAYEEVDQSDDVYSISQNRLDGQLKKNLSVTERTQFEDPATILRWSAATSSSLPPALGNARQGIPTAIPDIFAFDDEDHEEYEVVTGSESVPESGFYLHA